MELLLVVGVFILLFALRVPIGISLGISSVVGVLIAPTPMPLSTLPTAMWQGVNSSVLLAVPFFLMLGHLALASGITDRLVQWAGAFVGHVKGGLAQINITVSMVMAGMSGSDLSDAAASGSILIPSMKKKGYAAGYAAALTEASASVGPLIPPSVTLILVGVVTQTSVGRLFLAGAIPGIMLGLLLMVQARIAAQRHNFPSDLRVAWVERLKLTGKVSPVLLLPLAVLGAIIFGITTVTEAAVVGVVAVTLLGVLAYRQLSGAAISNQLYETLRLTASIFFLLAMASAFARVLALYGAPRMLAEFVTAMTDSPVAFLLGVIVVYLLLGMFIEPVPVILVFVPLLTPSMTELGVDPLQFGVVTVFSLVIGLMTPPFGLGMYLVCRIAQIQIDEYLRWAWPMVLLMIGAVTIVALVPPLSTFLPQLLMPR